jgi:hypothetical protein
LIFKVICFPLLFFLTLMKMAGKVIIMALEPAKRKWWPIPLGVASNSLLVKKYGNYLLQKRRGFHTFGKGRTRHLSIQPFG